MRGGSGPAGFVEDGQQAVIEVLGGRGSSRQAARVDDYGDRHYSYEDEDQSASPYAGRNRSSIRNTKPRSTYTGPKYNSIDNIADFFASRGKKFSRPQVPVDEPSGQRAFRPGQRVKHPKYGEGIVYKREGEGESAKITVQFPRFGLKKLV